VSEKEFEATLDRLVEERGEAEARYFDALEEYRRRMTRLGELASAAEEAAARIEGWPARTGVSSIDVEAGPGATSLPAPEPWPEGDGLRGRLNGFLRWVLRDYLESLDRREERLEAVADAIDARVDAERRALRHAAAQVGPQLRGLVDYAESIGDVAARTHALTEALRESVEALRSAVDLLEPLAETGRLLGDAKHAEVLRRATEGPVRRSELLFDEIERRQEALLARLARKAGSNS
jgi:hypothetical protein